MCLKLMGDEKTTLPTDGGPEILLRGVVGVGKCLGFVKTKSLLAFPNNQGRRDDRSIDQLVINTGVSLSLALLIMHAQSTS